MYVSVMTFAILALVIVSAEVASSIAYVHTQTVRAASHVAEAFFPVAEDAYSKVVAKQIQSAFFHGQSYTIGQSGMPSVNDATSPATPFCLDVQGKVSSGTGSCHYTGTYTVTTVSASTKQSTVALCANVTSSECSTMVNTDVGEQRVSIDMVVTIRDASNTTVATKTRTVTLRTFNFAPYVAIVDSAETRDVLGGGWARPVTEGDTAGCAAGSGCGDPTTIDSYTKCIIDTSSTITAQVQQKWCDANPTNTGYSHNVTSPQDHYVSSSTDVNETWTNANANGNGTP